MLTSNTGLAPILAVGAIALAGTADAFTLSSLSPALVGRRAASLGLRPHKRSLGHATTTAMQFWNPFAAAGPGAAEKRESAKSNLRQLIKTGPKNGYGASEALQVSVTKACRDVIALNPTKGQASSPLLDGDWELLYTSTPGASAGKLGPFIGDVEQRIDLKAAQYDNVVKIGGGAVEAVLSARWEVPKDGKGNTWLVLFNDIRIKVLGLPLVNKKFDQVERSQILDTLDKLASGKDDKGSANAGTWKMEYTDEDLRILYAQGSKKDQAPNVYVLAKMTAAK